MKKHLIIAGIICVASIPSAYAVTKCVKLTSSTRCTTSSANWSDWSATCGGIKIQGVALCGSQNAASEGKTFETVTTSLTPDDNKHCWCKMVSPAVSFWVFSDSYLSAGICATNCARNCGFYAQDSSAFRSGLFSELSD